MKKLGLTLCLAAAALFCLAGILRAQEIEIIHQIPRHSSGYGGGVCAHPATSDFKIYETWVSSSSDARAIYIKDPVTGQEVARLHGPWIDGAHDITYDSKRDLFWITLWGAHVVSISPTTGSMVNSLGNPIKYTYGIFYDQEIDRLWVASPYYGQIVRVHPDTGAVEETITVHHGMGKGFESPSGLVKTGETFWCGVAGEYGVQTRKSYIVEINRQGYRTGRVAYRMPDGKYAHDIGGFSLDPDGYLWVKGGKETAIYQFDIGYTPSGSSMNPIIDSGDYTGDGTSDLAIFRPASGLWAIKGVTRAYFGQSGDIPASGDYSGDGTTDIAVFRPTTGLWAVQGGMRTYFGADGDIPVPGDYTGDGTVDAAIFRPASGLWAVQGGARAYFGALNDIPVPFYPNGRDNPKEIAIFRPASGLWAAPGFDRTYFGAQGDQPVIGNDAEPAIFRAASGLWAVQSLTRFYFGQDGDLPVPGNYTGFLPDDPAVFRAVSGLWAVRGVTRTYFGTEGDIPVSGVSINPSSAVVL